MKRSTLEAAMAGDRAAQIECLEAMKKTWPALMVYLPDHEKPSATEQDIEDPTWRGSEYWLDQPVHIPLHRAILAGIAAAMVIGALIFALSAYFG